MNQVAIIIILNESYYKSRYCIENLVSKTKYPATLYICDNGSEDERIKNYFEDYCKKNDEIFERLEKPLSYASVINHLLKKIDNKIVCIVPVNLLVSKDWLEDLIVSYTNCENPGVISIRTGNEKTLLTPLIHHSWIGEDYFYNVWVSEGHSVEGLTFFKKSLIDTIGFFDENLNAPGFELSEFCLRLTALGYKNYYIRNQTCVKIDLENEILFPKKTHEGSIVYKTEIEKMIKEKNFKKI